MLMSLVVAAGSLDAATHRREIEAWQKARDVRLRSDSGWLTLAGLFWLKPGVNRFGADGANDIVLPAHASPARAGIFVVAEDEVAVEISPGVMVTLGGKPVMKAALRSDAGGATPDLLTMGSLTMQVIERNGRLAIRLKDSKSKVRSTFKGLGYFPVNPRYRIVARFIPHPDPVTITVPNVLGFSEALPSPGYAQFELGGKTYRLDPVIESPGDTQLFFIFRDQTAGRATYGSGRFLYADPPQNGRVVLDFNKAYSPPCAFTSYATCPLPPQQNRLPIAVEAGELFGRHD